MLYCELHYCSSLDNFYYVDLVLDDYDYNKILIIKFKTWVYILERFRTFQFSAHNLLHTVYVCGYYHIREKWHKKGIFLARQQRYWLKEKGSHMICVGKGQSIGLLFIKRNHKV